MPIVCFKISTVGSENIWIPSASRIQQMVQEFYERFSEASKCRPHAAESAVVKSKAALHL